MKHLLIATDSFLPRWDGVARFLSEIIPELTSFRITVVAPAFPGTVPSYDHVRIVQLPLVKRYKFGDITFTGFHFKKMKELVAEADLVWTHTIGPVGISAVRAARKLKKHIVAYVHSIEWELSSNSVARFRSFVYLAVRRIARYIYNKFDLIIVPTKEAARILQFNKIRSPKVVVYLGVKSDRFLPTGDKAAAKKRIGINPSRVVIGYSGRIAREKDLTTLVRAFLKLQMTHDNLTLLLVGDGPENQKAALQKRNVILAGSQSDIVRYLRAMDIYVLPSLTETSSLSTMEAMSCGIPVVATRVGFVKYYVVDGVNGMLIPKRNARKLSEKLNLLVSDARLRKKMGAMSRKTIEEKHQWKTTVERIRKILMSY